MSASVSGSCECLLLHGKGELRLPMELRELISLTGDGRIVLDYPSGPSAITGAFVRGRGRQESPYHSGAA